MPRQPGAIAVYALTPKGVRLARELARGLQADLYAPRRFAREGEQGFDSLRQSVERNFSAYAGHVFVAAAGIVVRAVAGLLAGKDKDPGVTVLDQDGRFAVSLLSGHLGGGNDLARRAAAITGGQAVITTATDTAGLPSLDLLARDSGLAIENLAAVKTVNAALLEGKTVQVFDPQGALHIPPAHAGHFQWVAAPHLLEPDGASAVVSWKHVAAVPGGGCLLLRPRVVAAGVGCRKGASCGQILQALRAACAVRGVAVGSVAVLATIGIKRHEAGLLEAARVLGVDILYYEAEALAAVRVPNPSPNPLKHVGVESVCEAAALLAAKTTELLVPKTKTPTATAALALLA